MTNGLTHHDPATQQVSSPPSYSTYSKPPRDLAALEHEILQPGLRVLEQVDPELLFINGQLLYHHRTEQGGHVRYFISPSAARVAFLEGAFDTGWIDPSIVRYGDNGRPWIVQFFPPTRRTLQVEVTADLVEQIEGAIAHPDLKPPVRVDGAMSSPHNTLQRYVVNLSVWLPGMVAFVQGSAVFLWAVKTKSFDPNAPLFKVPIPNVHSSGGLCFGQETPSTKLNTINRLWDRWWGSVFNADLNNQKSNQFSTDVRLQLIQLHISKKRYPLKDLMPAGERPLEDVIQSFINQ
jgi:Prokaryotic E2 family D